MNRVAIGCKVCGTRIVTNDMAEAAVWNDGHDAKCETQMAMPSLFGEEDAIG